MSQERAPHEENLVSIFGAPDEATATMLLDFLAEQGIEATLVSSQIPWFGTIEAARKGHWGRIAVLEKDAARARDLIEDFYAAKPEPGPEIAADEEGEAG
jgi:hypothetical protein